MVVSFDIDHKEAWEIMMQEVRALYPDYTVQIVTDVDASDLA